MTTQKETSPDLVLIGLSVAVALMAALFLQDAAFVRAGGAYDYPGQAPYMHLAAAERLASGRVSSIPAPALEIMTRAPLFTAALATVVGTGWANYAPLLLNALGLVFASVLWGRILWQGALGGTAVGLLLAVSGPVVLFFPGLAFLGAEHGLSLASSLAVVSGLIHFLDQRRVSKLLVLGVLLSPLVRVDGVLLALEAGLIVLAFGRFWAAAALLLVALVPLLGVFLWLHLNGVDLAGLTWLSNVLNKELAELHAILSNVDESPALAVAIAIGAAVFVLSAKRRLIVLPALIAGLAVLVFAGADGAHTPEAVAVATLAASIFAATQGRRLLRLLGLVPFCAAAYFYVPTLVNVLPHLPQVQQLGPGQIGRLAVDHLGGRIATDTLGQHLWRQGVADWRSEARFGAPVPDDVVLIAASNTAEMPNWARLGVLEGPGRAIHLFAREGEQDDMRLLLIDWVAGLPAGARFTSEGAPTRGQ